MSAESAVTVTRRVTLSTQRIKPTEVLELLKKGYTRLAKDDKGYGSIQSNYNLSALAVKKLFRTPSLKFRKTIVPDFILDEGDEVRVTEADLIGTLGYKDSRDAIPDSKETLFS